MIEDIVQRLVAKAVHQVPVDESDDSENKIKHQQLGYRCLVYYVVIIILKLYLATIKYNILTRAMISGDLVKPLRHNYVNDGMVITME